MPAFFVDGTLLADYTYWGGDGASFWGFAQMVVPEHQFSKGLTHFEQAVFDGACLFVTSAFSGRGNRTRHEHGLDLEAAIADAASNPRAVVYAVAPSGRHMVLDRAQWGMWQQRWASKA